MQLTFYKYQGTGNDFILIDNRVNGIELAGEQVKLLCDRRFGIGADGLMLLESEPGVDFRMVYYNSDGRLSSFCGNGGRCITAFARRLGVVEDTARFTASDGLHEARIAEDGRVWLKMQDVKQIETAPDHCWLDTGSPHYVTEVNGVDGYDVVGEGRRIRESDRFKNEGTNVNFMERRDDGIFVRTYERGVEDETFSCGTGVAAAALVAAVKGLATSRNHCVVHTRGGDLEVSFERVLDANFYNIWLKGPAVQVFEGSIDIQD
jgi:diaminopimelate epimerase